MVDADPLAAFETEVKRLLESALKQLDAEVDDITPEIPPEDRMGDFAFPCFPLARQLKKAPNIIAGEIVKTIPENDNFSKVENQGGYVNFFINKDRLIEKTLNAVLESGENYGSRKGPEDQGIVIVEFFHANLYKAVHVGHFRNIVLGDSLARVLEFEGKNVKRVNYQGDVGPHATRWLDKAEQELRLVSKNDRDDWWQNKFDDEKWLQDTYTAASFSYHSDPNYYDKIQKENKILYDEIRRKRPNESYQSDYTKLDLWWDTKKWYKNYFQKIYNELNIHFDKLYFESEVEDVGRREVLKLKEKGIAQEDQGAIIVDLKEHDLGIYLVLKSDGTPLYSTKDIGLATKKVEDFKHIDKSIHVVGSEQSLYFRQLFKTFELMNHPLANKSYHLSYELVTLKEGKMSSREGTVVLYSDLLREAKEKVRKEVVQRHPDMPREKVEEITGIIAIGALKYSMVKVQNNKRIVFDWEEALSLEGDSGPYVQYGRVRANSILGKAEEKGVGHKLGFNPEDYDSEYSSKLVKEISKFPRTVKESARQMKPYYIAKYANDLVSTFNRFYRDDQVLGSEREESLLTLVRAYKTTLDNALELLGIRSPEVM